MCILVNCRATCRGLGARSAALLVAVPALQRPLVEPPAGLLARGLPHDVRHPPGAVPCRGAPPQRGAPAPLLGGRPPGGPHDVDVCCGHPATQRVPALPRMEVLPRTGQRDLAHSLPPQPRVLAVAHAAHVSEQEAAEDRRYRADGRLTAA